jgi:hypothetical protein
MSIRIIGDPDNQRPDKWSSTVFIKWHAVAQLVEALRYKRV